MESIDLTDIIPADETVKEIMKPGGIEGTGWKITLAGPAHPKAVKWANDKQRRELKRAERIEAAQANGRKVKPEERDVDETRRETVGWVVSRILDWTPVKIGGEEFPFSDEAAMNLLLRPSMGWAFGQIAEWLEDERSFTKASAKS